jgi:hypothetical protein
MNCSQPRRHEVGAAAAAKEDDEDEHYATCGLRGTPLPLPLRFGN